MNEVTQFLENNPVQYLGTVGLDGKAKIRPFAMQKAFPGYYGEYYLEMSAGALFA